jgi:hypothetical protein
LGLIYWWRKLKLSTAALSSTKTIIEEDVIWLSGWFLARIKKMEFLQQSFSEFRRDIHCVMLTAFAKAKNIDTIRFDGILRE